MRNNAHSFELSLQQWCASENRAEMNPNTNVDMNKSAMAPNILIRFV